MDNGERFDLFPGIRRHPEQTVLYQVVQQHLETYLALAGEDDWDAAARPGLRGA